VIDNTNFIKKEKEIYNKIENDYSKYFYPQSVHRKLNIESLKDKKIFFTENRWVNGQIPDMETLSTHYGINLPNDIIFCRELTMETDMVIVDHNFLRFMNNTDKNKEVLKWAQAHKKKLYWMTFFPFFTVHHKMVNNEVLKGLYESHKPYYDTHKEEILKDINEAVLNLDDQESCMLLAWIYSYLTDNIGNEYSYNYNMNVENFMKFQIIHRDSPQCYFDNDYFKDNGLDYRRELLSYVDVGGNNGDTIECFFNSSEKRFSILYGIELDKANYALMCAHLARLSTPSMIKNSILLNKEVNDTDNSLDNILSNPAYKGMPNYNQLGETSKSIFKIFAYDGYQAICGAQNVIKAKKPYIAMNYEFCNRPDVSFGIFKTINLLKKLVPEYKIYLEMYSIFLNAVRLYAVPSKQ